PRFPLLRSGRASFQAPGSQPLGTYSGPPAAWIAPRRLRLLARRPHRTYAGGSTTFARFGPREPPPRQHPFGSGHAALSARLPVALRPAAFASWEILCPLGRRSASRPPYWPCQARTGLLRSARPRCGRGGSALYPGARCPPREQGKPPRSLPGIAVEATSGDLT